MADDPKPEPDQTDVSPPVDTWGHTLALIDQYLDNQLIAEGLMLEPHDED
jgi:hypothetical protein